MVQAAVTTIERPSLSAGSWRVRIRTTTGPCPAAICTVLQNGAPDSGPTSFAADSTPTTARAAVVRNGATVVIAGD